MNPAGSLLDPRGRPDFPFTGQSRPLRPSYSLDRESGEPPGFLPTKRNKVLAPCHWQVAGQFGFWQVSSWLRPPEIRNMIFYSERKGWETADSCSLPLLLMTTFSSTATMIGPKHTGKKRCPRIFRRVGQSSVYHLVTANYTETGMLPFCKIRVLLWYCTIGEPSGLRALP